MESGLLVGKKFCTDLENLFWMMGVYMKYLSFLF